MKKMVPHPSICRKEISKLFRFPHIKNHKPKLLSLPLSRGSKLINSKKNHHDRCDHHCNKRSSKESAGEGSHLMISIQELSDGCLKRSNSVGKGQLAVYVGPESKRYVIPTSYLCMPDLKVLMDRVAEEYGHDHHKDGGLRIPVCEEEDFQDILEKCSRRHRIMSKTTRKLGKLNIIHL